MADYTVTGFVRDAYGQPARLGTSVEALRKGLRSEELLSQTTITGVDGHYTISFVSLDNLDFVVRAKSGDEVFVTSPTVFNAQLEETVDLMVGGATYSGASEYEELQQSLDSILEDQEMVAAEISVDDEEFLAGETGYDVGQIHAYAVAARLAAEAEDRKSVLTPVEGDPVDMSYVLPASVCYAFARAGLAEKLDLLFEVRASKFDQVLDAALEGNVVPHGLIRTRADIDQRLGELAQYERVRDEGKFKLLMDTLDVATPLDPAELEKLARAEMRLAGTTDDLWDELSLPSNKVEAIKATAQLGELTLGETDLVRELQMEVRDGNPADRPEPRRLADRDQTWWQTAVTVVPDGVEGADETEKKNNYIAHLMRTVERQYPTRVVAREIDPVAEPELADLKTYLDNNPDWTFEASDVPEVDPTLQEQLAQWQRVFRMAPEEGRKEVITQLLGNGMDSAVSVLRAGYGAFMTQFGESLGEETAEAVWQKAHQRGIAVTMWTMRTAEDLFGTPTKAYLINEDAQASWRALFDDIDFCECEHCASTDSPAAYLADLLHWLRKGPKNTANNVPLDVLLDRRPDLDQLELSCQNTEILVPYIDLVNEILESAVLDSEPEATSLIPKPSSFSGTWWTTTGVSITADAEKSPSGQTDADTLVEDISTGAHGVAGASLTTSSTRYAYSVTLKAAGRKHARLLVAGASAFFDLENGAVGATTGAVDAGTVYHGDGWYLCWLSFDASVGAATPEIQVAVADGEATYQGSGQSALYACLANLHEGTYPQSLIRSEELRQRQSTGTTEELGAMPEYQQGLAYLRLKGAYYPWNLPFDLGWEEVNAFFEHLGFERHAWRRLLGSEAIDVAKAHLKLTEVGHALITGATLPNHGDVAEHKLWGLASGLTPLGDVDTFLDQVSFGVSQPRLPFKTLKQLLSTAYLGTSAPTINYPTDACSLKDAELTPAPTEATCKAMRCFLQLRHVLGWSVLELDKAITAFGTTEINDNFLIQLSNVEQLRKELSVSLTELFAWYGTIDTAEDLSETEASKKTPSLYEQLFLAQTVEELANSFFNLKEDRTDLADTSRLLSDTEVQRIVAQALQVTVTELGLMLNYLSTSAANFDLERLSSLFRMASLSRALKLSIRELVSAIGLLGNFDPFASKPLATTRTLDFVEKVKKIDTSKFSVAELDYLLRHHYEEQDGVAPTDEEVASAVADVRDALDTETSTDLEEPTFVALDFESKPPGTSNLSRALTINKKTMHPTFFYKGENASGEAWGAEVGEGLSEAGSGDSPSYAQGSPLMGKDDSVAYQGGKRHQRAGDNTYGDPQANDWVLEMLIKPEAEAAVVAGKYTSSAYWEIRTTAAPQIRCEVKGAAGSATVVFGQVTPGAWYHLMLVYDASGSALGYLDAVEGSTTAVSGVGDLTSASDFAIGSRSDGSNASSSTLGYLAMWEGSDWLDTHDQASLVKQRFEDLTSLAATHAAGEARPTVSARDSEAYLDKYNPYSGSVELYKVGNGWLRTCRRLDSNGEIITGYLAEAAGTNRLLQSNDFSTTWTPAALASVLSDNVVSPIIGKKADTAVEDGTNAIRQLKQQVSVTDGKEYTLAVLAKAGNATWLNLQNLARTSENSTYIDLENGVLGTDSADLGSGILGYGDGWYLCWCAVTCNATTSKDMILGFTQSDGGGAYQGTSGAEAMHIIAAQLIEGRLPRSIIDTTTAEATRVADQLRYEGLANLGGFGSEQQGTIVCDVLLPNSSEDVRGRIITLTDGGAGGERTALFLLTSGLARGGFNSSSIVTNVSGTTCLRDGRKHSVALTWGLERRIAVYISGTQEADLATPSDSVPDDLDRIDIGQLQDATEQVNGLIANLRIYPKYLTQPVWQELAPGASVVIQTLASDLGLEADITKLLLSSLMRQQVHHCPSIEDFLEANPGGLSASYWSNETFGGDALVRRVDETVDFDWTSLTDPAVSSGPLSVRWAGVVAAISSGPYLFSVDVDSASTASLKVNDAEATLGADGLLTCKVQLERGRFYPLVLQLSNAQGDQVRVGLEWKAPDKQLFEVVPVGQLLPAESLEAYRALHKVALLVTKLGLAGDELQYLSERSVDFSGFDLNGFPRTEADPEVPFAQWEQLHDLFSFGTKYSRSGVRLVDMLAAAVTGLPEALNRLSDLTRWPPHELDVFAAQLTLIQTDLKQGRKLDLLQRCFTEIRKLGIKPAQLQTWTFAETAPVREARESFKAGYKREQWLTAAKKVRDILRKVQRDALASYVIHDQGLEDLDELYGKYLVDAAMEPCMQISRIKLALSTVQLFLQRCLMSLEDDVKLSPAYGHEWKWRKNYRVWEANRKIFLYPENWIEPELRIDKTPFFEELENELLENEVTKKTAEKAYRNYLAKLAEVARLEMVGMCEERVGSDDVLHVFGRTQGTPHIYYYRKGTISQLKELATEWGPWERVDLDIEGDHLVPVVWNGRLVLFWPIFEEETSTGLSIRLAWSERDDGKWTPKSVVNKPFVTSLSGPIKNRVQALVFDANTTTDGKKLVIRCHSRSYVLPNGNRVRANGTLVSFHFRTCLRQGGVHLVNEGLSDFFSPPGFSIQNQLLTPDPDLKGIYATNGVWKDNYLIRPTHANYTILSQYTHGVHEIRSFFYQDGKHTFFVAPRFLASYFLLPMGGANSSLKLTGGQVRFKIQDFYHPRVCEVFSDLNRFGVDGSLNPHPTTDPYHRRRQRALSKPSASWFTKFFNPQQNLVDTPLPSRDFDFSNDGSYSIYNWELFFHIPMLIAGRLQQNQKFEEAMKWYHYIFDPTLVPKDPVKEQTPYCYWKVRPIFEERPETLEDMLDRLAGGDSILERSVKKWKKHPFRPHVVARYRPVAYMKYVVMKYLDNLVAWGDQLFRRDSIESITEATQLYIRAAEILGKRPEMLPAQEYTPKTFNDLRTMTSSGPMYNALVYAENKMKDYAPSSLAGQLGDLLTPTAADSGATVKWDLYSSRVPTIAGEAEAVGSFSRSSTAFADDCSGGPDVKLISHSADSHRPAWRIDKNGTPIKGALLEPCGTNKLLQSNRLDSTEWVKIGVAVSTSEIASPTGATNANQVGDLCEVDSFIRQEWTASSPDIPLAPGFWINRVSTSGLLRIEHPVDSNHGAWQVDLAKLPDRWVRITRGSPYVNVLNEWSSTGANEAGLLIRAEAGGPLSAHFFNFQQEEGHLECSSDIPTTTERVTRETDSAIRWTEAAGFRGDEVDQGSLALDLLMPNELPGTEVDLLEISSGGSASDQIRVYLDTNGYLNVSTAATGGTAGAVQVAANCCDGAVKRMGVRFKQDRLEASVLDVNTEVRTDAVPATSLDIPEGLNRYEVKPSGGIINLRRHEHQFEQSALQLLDAASSVPIEVTPGGEITVNDTTMGSVGAVLNLPCVIATSRSATGVAEDVLNLSDFCLPHNKMLLQYWDTVADRLFKIRHCMNIRGVVRTLPQFQPPIDPALLVRAVAAGVDIASVLNSLSAELPNYRFRVMVRKALEFAAEVRSFGAALLAALEKRDAETLALLRAGHEVKLLDATKEVRKKQVDEAKAALDAVKARSKTVKSRKIYYEKLVKGMLSPSEKSQLSSLEQAQEAQRVAKILQIAGSVAHLLPDIMLKKGALPSVTTVLGGSFFGRSLQAYSGVFSMVAGEVSAEAHMSGILASHDRRLQEWNQQVSQAEKELTEIEQQIATAEVRKAITEAEKKNHAKQLQQAMALQQQMKIKFTNRQLYSWMVTQISGLYFQSYKLAHDLAKQAEQCYQHEIGDDSTSFIQFGYWDSLKKGLLAGDKLHFDLRRMEAAYLEANEREYELTKNVSLAQLDPVALIKLRETGECNVSLPEVIFDLDHPGHYMRRLKAVSLTIPCVAGPFATVSCTLELTGSRIRREANTSTPETEDAWRNDAIATSSAQNDSGLFELNFQDERYLPFEGAGAVSDWKVTLPSLPQFDYGTISDVIFHVRYTAREGGAALKASVESNLLSNLSSAGMMYIVSARHELPDAWDAFQNGTGSTREIEISFGKDQLPFALKDKTPTVVSVDVVLDAPDLTAPVIFTSPALTLSQQGTEYGKLWTANHVPTSGAPWTYETSNTVAEAAQDLVFVVHYTAS